MSVFKIVEGTVIPVDGDGDQLPVDDGVAVPANTPSLLITGKDLLGDARVPSVSVDSLDQKRRMAIEGKVSIVPFTPPPTAVQKLFFADTPEVVNGNQQVDDDFVITDGRRLYIQQVIVGSEGDPAFAGSVVRLFYSPDGGTTWLDIQKFYVRGDTYAISFPNIDEARDGTKINGVATNQGIFRIRRQRLGGGNQGIDATVVAYEDTP